MFILASTNAARGAKRQWRLFSTDRSGDQNTNALKRIKLDCCGVFDFTQAMTGRGRLLARNRS